MPLPNARKPVTAQADAPSYRVTVVFALPDRAWQQTLCVAPGTTLLQVVQASGFAQQFPAWDTMQLALGVYGQRCAPHRLVADGDRVEIYRPLQFDPMESRRRRVAHRARKLQSA